MILFSAIGISIFSPLVHCLVRDGKSLQLHDARSLHFPLHLPSHSTTMGPIGHVVRAAIHAHRDFHSDQGPSQDVGRSMRKPNRSLLYTPVYDLVTAIEAKASKRSARGEAPPAASHAQAQGPSYASQPSSGTSTPTSAAAKSPRTAQPQPISYQVVSYRPQDQDPPMYCQGNDIVSYWSAHLTRSRKTTLLRTLVCIPTPPGRRHLPQYHCPTELPPAVVATTAVGAGGRSDAGLSLLNYDMSVYYNRVSFYNVHHLVTILATAAFYCGIYLI